MGARRRLGTRVREASDGDGVSYALRYELDVRRVDERWEIAAIQTDPTT